jgi:signal transduction histidine kinase
MFNNKEEIFYSVIFSSIFFFLLIGIIVIAAILYHRRKKKYLLERANFQQTLMSTRLEIQEQTLQQISRELHDNFGLVATLIKINLTTLKPGDTEKIEATKDLSKQLITDIKALSVSLSNDNIAKTGIIKSIETELQRLGKTGLFKIDFNHTGPHPQLENDKATILYRMVQEVLNNMAKHSKANTIAVFSSVTETLFTLALRDNGEGFDVADKLKNGGAGLGNLYNRAKLIDAALQIESTKGNGSSFLIRVPLLVGPKK